MLQNAGCDKRPSDCLRTALPDGSPSTWAAVHHPRRRGYTVTCSCVNTCGPPPLIPAPTRSFFLPKNHYPAQARVLAHLAAIFDLLAQSSIHKTIWGDCSLVCDSSIGPISFCSSGLFVANLCCCGALVLELACRIFLVPSSSNAWYSL